MQHDEIEQLINRILATEDEEIDCGQLFELIAQYVDLEVSGENAVRLLPMVHQHLVQCNACSELHDTLHELVTLEHQDALPEVDDLLDEILAGSLEPVVGPPTDSLPGLRAGPTSRDSAVRSAPSVTPSDDFVPRSRRGEIVKSEWPRPWSRWGRWLLVAAAVLVMAILGAWGWRQGTEIAELKQDMAFIAGADRAVWMQGTEQDPDARGYLFINGTDKRGLLVIDGLNALPSDQVYQMWVMTDSTDAVSAGTFTVGMDKRGWIWVSLDRLPGEFTTVAITPEPVGGSLKPTSSPVCVWGKKL